MVNKDIYTNQTGPGRPRIMNAKRRVAITIDAEELDHLKELGIENFSEWIREKMQEEINTYKNNKWEKAAKALYIEFLAPAGYAFNDYILLGENRASVESLCLHAYQPAIFHKRELKKECREWFKDIRDQKFLLVLNSGMEIIDGRYNI